MSFKFKGFNKVRTDITAAITTSRVAVHQALGAEAVRLIQGETRSGNQMHIGNGSSKHKSLKNSTIRNRRYLSQYNTTHPAFSPERSNLTLTGQLLDAVTFKATSESATVFVKNNKRKPYKGKKGRHKTSPPTNAELAGYQAEMDRGFMELDKESENQLIRIAERFLRRALRRFI